MTTTGVSDADRARRIVERLIRESGSQRRLPHMLELLVNESTPVFWLVFLGIWNCCDDTWAWRGFLRLCLSHHGGAAAAQTYWARADREWFASLPDPVRVYRGCSRPRVRGLSWTADRAVAVDFARGHRGMRVPEPIIAEAMVPKEAVFAALGARQESELIIDPRRLRALIVHAAS